MLQVSRIVLREIRLKLKEAFRISSGASHERRIALVEVVGTDGMVGWGECVAGEAPHYSPETVDTAWLALRAWILGGTRTAVATGISLGIQQDPETLTDRARAALAEGYRRIKLKIAPGADVAFVRAVRKALGYEAPVMVDANSAYTLDEAAPLRELDAFGLLMIEQPLAHDDLVRHATVDHLSGSCVGHDQPGKRPHHQHQTRPDRRPRGVTEHP
jgi:O-succinylbenzoate synthase